MTDSDPPPSSSSSSSSSTPSLPPSLIQYYENEGLSQTDVTNYILNTTSTASHSRFVRLNPRFPIAETLAALSIELSPLPPPVPVPWLPSSSLFYAIPASSTLNKFATYKSGRVYGMDCSSGAAIAALNLPPLHRHPVRVLDLCCCPGAKLCMIADTLQANFKSSSLSSSSSSCCSSVVIGVDISEQRLRIAKRIISKYLIDTSVAVNDTSSLPTVRLIHGDGTTYQMFDSTTVIPASKFIFDSKAALEETSTMHPVAKNPRKRMNKSARGREAKRLQLLSSASTSATTATADESQSQSQSLISEASESQSHLFDYVLVDAECSTDGAIKHLKERTKTNPDAANAMNIVKGSEDFTELTALQLKLLKSGYRNLKKGGTLVYATCSLSKEQNEDVVEAFLKKRTEGECELVKIDLGGVERPPSHEGIGMPFTLRFRPNITRVKVEAEAEGVGGGVKGKGEDEGEEMVPTVLSGGGFFIAKLVKNL